MPRWVLWIAATISTTMALIVGWASVAAADTSTGWEKLGQTPPMLLWLQLTDSRGMSIWRYELSLDRGGVTAPDKFFWASITDACWGMYRAGVAVALWFLDWVMSFDWADTVASPLLSVGASMQQVVDRIGVATTFLTITALVAGVWMLKGRYTTAIWEVGIACVISALSSGFLAHPVELIAGHDGYVARANQTGQLLAAQLATGDSAGKTPEQLRKAQTGQLVDTFIRQPTELMNFGRVLDKTKCESVYNEVLAAGPYGQESDIRDKINDCDSTLGDFAANPSASMALGSMLFGPAAFVIMIMAIVLAGSVIAAGVWAMFLAMKAIVSLVLGLLPGGPRGSLMLTAAQIMVSLLIIVFTSVFLSIFLLVIQAMFAGASGDSVPRTFAIVDVMIVVGIVVYWRQRKQIRASSQRLAEWMSQRPGGAPATRLPERHRGMSLGSAATVVRTAASVAQLRAQRHAAGQGPAGPVVTDNRHQAIVFIGGLPPAGGRGGTGGTPGPGPGKGPNPPALPSGSGSPNTPAAPGGAQGATTPASPKGPGGPGAAKTTPVPTSPQGPGGGSKRVTALAKKGAGTLARAGLAYATGGTSTALAASKAARAARTVRTVQTARRAALGRRLSSASGTTGRTRPSTGRPNQSPPSTTRIRTAPPTPTTPVRPSPARPSRRVPPPAVSHPVSGRVVPPVVSAPPVVTPRTPGSGRRS